MPGEIAQLADRGWGYEAGPDQAVLDHLRDRRRVGYVGLAAGHVVQVLGVDQPHLELVFEQVVDRFPVDPGGLHSRPGDLVFGQPVAQRVIPAVVVAKVRVCCARRSRPDPGTRTVATTVSRCTSNPAQRCTNTSIPGSSQSASTAGPPPRGGPVDQESEVRARSSRTGCLRPPRHTSMRAHGTKRHRRRTRGDGPAILIRQGGPRHSYFYSCQGAFGAFLVVRTSADLGCWGHGGGEGAVELAGDGPLEAAPDLLGVLALGGAPGDVGLGGRAAAHPGRGDGV